MSVYPHEACDLSRESDSLRKCVVNLNNPLPRYYQVYFPLLAQFHAGKFKPGNPLPSERQLAQDHGITHITIIKAKDLPRRGNLIEHHAGRRSLVLRQDESPAGRASLKGWPEGTAVIAPPFALASVASLPATLLIPWLQDYFAKERRGSRARG
ncbi:MAG TPA: GntR family transcriptional regulator [Chloroflexi bacterium]|nr:GntR family transcriptional regulator [Chloroflexota bacterium]